MVTVALTTLIYTLFATAAYLVFFAVVRSTVFPLVYQIPGVNMVLRPFTAHFLRGQWTPLLFTRHWPLVTRAFYLALSTIGIWEFAESSFDSIVAQVRPPHTEPSHIAYQPPSPSLSQRRPLMQA